MPAIRARARAAVEARRWGEAFQALEELARAEPLEAEDHETMAVAAYMLGRDDASEAAWLAAHAAWLQRGARARAARCACWNATQLLFRGELAPARGWIERARRALDDEDVPERAWLRLLEADLTLIGGDPAAALAGYQAVADAAAASGDRDLSILAMLGAGQALVSLGRAGEAMPLLDEAMATILSDEVSPTIVGIAYCSVIGMCQGLLDVRRAHEWTTALARWCDAQPDLVPYRGNCLIHRSELLQLHGDWREADEAARGACEILAGPSAWDSLGPAHYQLGEIRRAQGDLDAAEAAYERASAAGHEPEPGMSLLRLARGNRPGAVASIKRVLAEASDPYRRAGVLPAAVEILLSARDVASARAAADELGDLAVRIGVPYVRALAATAQGQVTLEEGEAAVALPALRSAYELWGQLGARHQAARVRVSLARACRSLGDDATATLELQAARATFSELGAIPDLAVLDALGPGGPTSLSPREREVLVLVASGKTNRGIARELSISERTVARHVSNIFVKLDVPSRAAATAYAFQHGLV